MSGETAYWENLLRSSDASARRVREWFQKHESAMSPGVRNYVVSDLEMQPWEWQLFLLTDCFRRFQQISEWERAPAQERSAHLNKVARLLRELVAAIEEKPRPDYPPVLDFFAERETASVVEYLAHHLEHFVAPPDYACYASELERPPPPPGHQRERGLELADLLGRVSQFVASEQSKRSRAPRPNTTHANARLFARSLAEHFSHEFRLRPNEIIADCVALMFRDIDPPPDANIIRTWLGTR